MSTVFNLEPQPTAKVILHTTSGDLSLELFAQQTPLTSRNFLQLCLDSYYDNTIFHRLIPGFILQGGDPTGTGAGGESSHDSGKPFADEFHSRLKFNRRGLLGMANGGGKDDNGSQFFLTLGSTPELNGKNTMFGRVEAEGSTIFNLVKMGEADLVEGEGSERPMYPTRITGTEVLVNPFEDVVRRARVATTSTKKEDTGKKKVVKKKAGKQLLSFGGGEEGEDGADTIAAPIKVTKFNPLLVNTLPEPQAPTQTSQKRPAPSSKTIEPPTKRRQTSESPSTSPERPAAPSKSKPTTSAQSPSPSPPPPAPTAAPKPTPLTLATAQIAALKASLKRDVPTVSTTKEAPQSALAAMIPSTAIRGRKRKGGGAAGGASTNLSREEQRTLDEVRAFQRRLEGAGSSEKKDKDPIRSKNGKHHETVGHAINATADADDDEEAQLCDLHFIKNCQSCSNWAESTTTTTTTKDSNNDNIAGEAEMEDDDTTGWLGHKLSFAKDRLGKSLEWKRQTEKELLVIDPREKEREIKEGRKRGREKESGGGYKEGGKGGGRR